MLRDYQKEIANKACNILQEKKLVCFSVAVRVGKSLIAMETAKLFGANKVLFITKKMAFSSIKNDYKNFGYTFDLTVINKESIHTVIGNKFDLVVYDESHGYGKFPKPGKHTKEIRERFKFIPCILMSGTLSPESYSQLFHQFWLSAWSPFKHYKNFYDWARDYVNIKEIDYSHGKIKVYKDANYIEIQKVIEPYMIRFTQQEAGFETTITERIIEVEMKPETYALIKRLKRDQFIQGKEELIMADTPVKMMQKEHQMCSGTIKFESGNRMVLDTSKAEAINREFRGMKIGIFYKFVAEYDALKQVFGDLLTDNLDEFNATDKCIALQIVSGREGISLAKAKALVFYNIDFSAVSYWQARDRMSTRDRKENFVFWVFSKGGIEYKIYEQVKKKKSFTLNHYKKC